MNRIATRIGAASLISLVVAITPNSDGQDRGYIPKNGLVPDEKTAITIAEAVLIPIYGEKQVKIERPFHAKLDDEGIWTVEGSLLKHWEVGGVAVVKLQRDDGRILYVMHGK